MKSFSTFCRGYTSTVSPDAGAFPSSCAPNPSPQKMPPKQNTVTPNLPDEIVFDILSRLPIDGIARCRCVSKQLCSLIDDDSIRGVRRQIILVKTYLAKEHCSVRFMDQQGNKVKVRKPWEKSLFYEDLGILGSCNGLLLIRIRVDLYLWNPVTGYWKKVCSYKFLADGSCSHIGSGLCHDSSTNEYKAVFAFTNSLAEFAVVGSFRNKSWTQVYYPYSASYLTSATVLNEHLHWVAGFKKEISDRLLAPRIIVSFDPQAERFEEVPMPRPKNEHADIFGIGALDGCLCIVRSNTPVAIGLGGSVEVLAMQKYGVENSWTTLFSISNLVLRWGEELQPLCYTNENKVTLKIVLEWEQNLWVYDPKDNSRQDIPLPRNEVVDAVVCMESLVIPPSYDWEEEELNGEPTYEERFLPGFRLADYLRNTSD